MSVKVILYSVYVEGVGVKLFTRLVIARQYKINFQGSDVVVWGVGQHNIEVDNCIEKPDPKETKKC